ncbi:hypothetical protein KIW84_073236 [Lathyrus oleraceus]|uniref:Uncharacterized protein n=1 Tax=Pisum sativum TaxID=3888 RepID=A0A9D4ZVA7_PEA|nr:hypothetical protein KIW84_073236 [Pisum sativum]
MKSGMVSFEDRAPNVKANPLPAHGNSSVNMVDGCPGEFKVFDVRFIRRSLVQMHKDVCLVSECEHDHDGCAVCSVNPRGCEVVKRDIQKLMDEGMIQIVQSHHVDDDVNVIVPVFKQHERLVIQYDSSNSNSQRSLSPLVIRLAGPIPYSSNKVVPYQYNAIIMKDGQEVPLPTTSSVVSIVGVTKLLQTPSKISVLSLLLNSEAHREALQRVLEQSFVEHDVTMDQFYHIVANITYCNNMSFCDEELPEEGRNHNLALHISMNCKEDALSNVLVDTGSSLNMLSKSTLSKLYYQGAPMRYSGVIVKAFDGSRKTEIGEVDLPVKIR